MAKESQTHSLRRKSCTDLRTHTKRDSDSRFLTASRAPRYIERMARKSETLKDVFGKQTAIVDYYSQKPLPPLPQAVPAVSAVSRAGGTPARWNSVPRRPVKVVQDSRGSFAVNMTAPLEEATDAQREPRSTMGLKEDLPMSDVFPDKALAPSNVRAQGDVLRSQRTNRQRRQAISGNEGSANSADERLDDIWCEAGKPFGQADIGSLF